MNIQEIAKKIAITNKYIAAEYYDLFYREYDNNVEVLGFVPDPTYDIEDFRGREMLFPKRWVTLGVVSADTRVKV